ncbi:4Fe-4S binding protein [Halarcobacter ebronensis]|uniref:Ferredoxin n=1 Tax=Halarcobacter ebronensis TaxID=1462615 RepID=A0A4Q1AMJ8_9BACT|nr:4Fe-4S binding protein [Halarcobacter ebronensis]QKF83246.1 polyferredoxin-like protein [Halarcobacter ebronensis]RXK05119.1 ferredoxin [Halarcobacter ebronensis]
MITSKNRDFNDIFAMPILKVVFKNRVFIKVIQLLTLSLFVYAIFLGFKEPTLENSFTRYLFWGLFWSLFMVVSLVTFGRVFCGICPHGFLGKYITKLGLKKEMPKFLQNRYIGIMILVIGWWFVYYSFPSFWKTPFNTALMFTILTLLSVTLFYLYKDMSYCKFICPIGTLTRAFNKISFTSLKTYSEDCKECKTFECAKACSYNLKPFTFEKKNSMEDCSLCMDCSSACEAVSFKVEKPSNSLFSKFKINSAEVWTYILIIACIPITMSFHHGLNRTNLANEFIWSKTAAQFEQLFNLQGLDTVGMFSFLYALIFSILTVFIGMFLASKLLKSSFNTTLYTLGYAFIPIFVIGGLAHLLHSFFTHTYADIANGFIYGFNLDLQKVENLASRDASWLKIFSFFPYLAVVWAYLILAKRLKFFEASTLKKVFAFFFASALISLYLFLNLYRIYVFNTYGVKEQNHRHQTHTKTVEKQPTVLTTSKEINGH